MDPVETKQGRKDDREDENIEEKDAEAKPVKSNNHRKARKNDKMPGTKLKTSRPNSAQNRRESSRSRSRSRSQSRQSSAASSKKSWKSANAWLNFVQDFREVYRDYPASRRANAFRLASEEWSQMTAKQKKPYIDAANKIKRQKERENDGERRKKSKTKRKVTKTESTPKVLNKKQKRNQDEENDEKSDSESDTGTEASGKTVESDNASVDTDGSI